MSQKEHTGQIAYPHPLIGDALFEPRTLWELAMIRLSSDIRSKPNWWEKRKDPAILAKWKREILATRLVWNRNTTLLESEEAAIARVGSLEALDRDTIVELNEKQVDYVLQELEGYARQRDEATGIEVACFDGTYKSSRLIPSELRRALIDNVKVLEDVPDSKKDWHPNSNEQVLDLVHPSLYCLVYGHTLAYKQTDSGKRELAPIPAPDLDLDRWEVGVYSKKYAWIPTDFQVGEDGTVKALGYINNLHPSHQELYGTIERVLGAFVPLFEYVLTDLVNPLPHRITGNYKPIDDPKEDGTDGYYGRIDEFWEEWEKEPYGNFPDVPDEGYTGGLEERGKRVSLKGKKIQVIVKLANIHLTPEKPEYNGGSWHVEGMVNERIVASGIYYFQQENITSSELGFRIAIDEPEPAKMIQADRYDYYAHYKMWGMEMDYSDPTKLNQHVGSIETSEGVAVGFPNLYQHCVSPFKLQDPSKSGVRKILAFFLVDPNIDPIPSTSDIPPQQRTWALDALRDSEPTNLIHRLPAELFGMIEDRLGTTDDEKAKEVRLDLMEERTAYLGDEDKDPFARLFNLCEH